MFFFPGQYRQRFNLSAIKKLRFCSLKPLYYFSFINLSLVSDFPNWRILSSSPCTLSYLLTNIFKAIHRIKSLYLYPINLIASSFCLTTTSSFFVFLGLHLQHTLSSQARGWVRATPPVYTTAMWDPSPMCDLHHSSRQRQILDPLREARDGTSASWILVRCVSAEPRQELLTPTLSNFQCAFLSDPEWI